MHTDLMLLYLLYLWIMIITKKKSWAKLLPVNLLPSTGCTLRARQVTQYRTVWATFSRYFLLIALSLACAIRIVATRAYFSVAPLLGKLPQQLDCRENWVYAYKIHQFSQYDHPSSIDL